MASRRKPVPPDQWSIYALKDPRTNEVRYVGWARNVDRRLRDHMRDARAGNQTYKARWIRTLLDQGVKPAYDLLDKSAFGDWADAERWWIKRKREEGCRLTNATDGGDGMLGHVVTPETKELIRAAHLGVGHTDETRAVLSRHRKGMVLPEAWRANISAALKRRPREIYDAVRSAQKGRVKSAEECANIAAAKRGKPRPPGLMDAFRAKAHTPEAIAKMLATRTRNRAARAARSMEVL